MDLGTAEASIGSLQDSSTLSTAEPHLHLEVFVQNRGDPKQYKGLNYEGSFFLLSFQDRIFLCRD